MNVRLGGLNLKTEKNWVCMGKHSSFDLFNSLLMSNQMFLW